MNSTKKHKLAKLFFILLSFACLRTAAQDEQKDVSLKLAYFNSNNKTHYLAASAKTKVSGKFQPAAGVNIKFYITNDSVPSHFLGEVATNEKGDAVLMMPPAAQSEWQKNAQPAFVAVSPQTKTYAESRADLAITKAKIKIDTTEDRKIMASVLRFDGTTWTPVPDVEMKVAVKRLGGDLNVGETETYTTDSTGAITADFLRDSLPGNQKGILTLVAKVEDNDTYGNLSAEIQAPWGVAVRYISPFDKRTLFARRGHAPIWLETMAYSIILLVWGVILYLMFLVSKIKKLGYAGPAVR